MFKHLGLQVIRAQDCGTIRCGNRIYKKYIYRILNNRACIGEAVHKGENYPGEHDAIIDRGMWDHVHTIMQESARKRAERTSAETPALLKSLLFGPDDAALSKRKKPSLHAHQRQQKELRSRV